MFLQALRDECIVEVVYENKSSIIIPENAQKYKQYDGAYHARVISVGPKCKLEVKPGDKISYVRHEGKKIEYEGKLYFAMKSKWILGRYE